MKKEATSLLYRSHWLLAVLLFISGAGELAAKPFLYDVRHYDEYNGLSQRWATQVVQGIDGYIWVSTWNGLDRFDGYDFVNFKSTDAAGAQLPNDRVSDMWLLPSGRLLCFVDNRLLVFDTRAYTFTNPLRRLEQRLGRHFSVYNAYPQKDGTVWVACEDGQLLSFSDGAPEATARLRKPGSFRYPRRVIDKHFVSLPGHDMREAEYCITDRGGNLWFRSNYGIYVATPYTDQYSLFALPRVTQVRGLFRDRSGRIWVGGRENKFVMLLNSDGSLVGYLGADGRLHNYYTEFGASVYSAY